MTLLFGFRHRKAVEPFAALIATMADRGHRVLVGLEERDPKVPRLFERPGRLEFLTFPAGRRDGWTETADLVRALRDYAQYLEAPYRDATKLRGRAFERLLKQVSAPEERETDWSGDALLGLGEDAVRRVRAALASLETALPTDALHDQVLARLAPDALVVSPLVHFGSTQVEIVKSARKLRIPIGMLLFSWDNLSTKGALHVPPDRLFVWNERQRREAAELHGFPEERVTVTGAPRFDAFADLASRVPRDAFCASLGVDPSTRVLLYLCSSRLVSGKEMNFIRRWARVIRASSDPQLSGSLLVVRPHPDLPLSHERWITGPRTFRWPGVDDLQLQSAVLFGDERTVMLTSDYWGARVLFECLQHCQAVIGLNTSAEIEAGIVGRPVYTILTSQEYADGQQSTLHFHYLMEEQGGFVRSAASLEAHVEQLARELANPTPSDAVRRRVERFVRPAGWERSATEVTADALERDLVTASRASSAMPASTQAAGVAAAAAAVASSPREPGDAGGTHPDGESGQAPGAFKLALRNGYQPTRLDWDGPAVWVVGPREGAKRTRWSSVSRSGLGWLAQRVSPGDVLFDLTAGGGLWAVAAARMLGCTVYAFEANLAALECLWQNVLVNACDGIVVPVPARVAMHTELRQEQFSSARPDAERRSRRRQRWREHESLSGPEIIQPVLSMPLEWAIKRWKLAAPSALRLEISDHDDELVAAVQEVLPEPRLSAIVVEARGARAAEIAARLGAAGWRLADRSATPDDEPAIHAFWRESRGR
jgi:hypothetical protein